MKTKTFTSRLFGEVEYTDRDVYTFPGGIMGFPDHRHYVLHEDEGMSPLVFLMSVDPGGPEVALIAPEDAGSRMSASNVPLDKRMLERLRCRDAKALDLYAIVTVPDNIKQISMNLRTPILLNHEKRRGMQYPAPGLEWEPVRQPIYRELIASRPQDKLGRLIVHRHIGETIEIGDEISIELQEYANGGVRLAVTAPKHVKVSRGDDAVTPRQETIRAARDMDLPRLEGLMRMHKVMQDPEGTLPATVLQPVEEPADEMDSAAV